ncbi:MAG: DNA polymerase III subunit gamma/tau, partial [Bdellovibrionota bacterium]
MSYLSLARKYRPNTFSDLVGQESVGLALANAIRLKREPRGVIFTGVRGIGKTTTARIYAKALNCENGPTPEPCNVCASCVAIQQGTHEDVLEIDGASNTGVDDVRALQETLAYVPQRSTFKIYIIDEVHMLSVSAFNALLKTLEEPPEHVVFIFATTELHKVPETIQSRCQVFHLQKISTALTKKRIAGILVSEGIEFEDRAIQWIAREGKGSLRDALTLLDQVIAVGGGRVEWSAVEPMVNTGHAEPIFEMLGMLIVKDSAGILAVIARWDQEGLPMTVLVEELVKACRNAFVLKSVSQSAGDIELMDVEERELEALRLLGASAQVLDLNRLFRSFVKCLDDLRNSELDRFVVENYALEWCLDPGLPDLTSLMHGVGAVGKAVGVASPVGRSQVGAGIGAASPVVSSAVVGVGVGEAAKPSMDLRDRWKKASGQQAAPTVSVEAKIGASVSEGLTPAKSVVQAQVQVESNDHFAAKAIVQSHVAAAPQPSAPVYGAPSAPLKQSQVTAQGFVATSAQP